MMNPLHFKKVEIQELINVYKNEKIFKFIHLCVQSGSDKILGIMRRGYTKGDFIYYVERFREEIPEITLWTDIIVGHPGESEEDFRQSMELIKEVKPDFVNVSAYGVKGTRSALMNQIHSEIKKERTRIMSNLAAELCLQQNKRWIGWSGPALVDEFNESKNNFIARNYVYKPIVVNDIENVKLGDIIRTKIVDAEKTCLVAEKDEALKILA
jgi:tRNA A37 methylthiotransferase MiaB